MTVRSSRGFASLLARERISLAVTNYDRCQLLLIGAEGIERVTLDRKTTGLAIDGDMLHVATPASVWSFVNAGHGIAGSDRLYVPRHVHLTGDLDTHELAIAGGELALAASRFSCVAALDRVNSFREVWRPAFIDALAPEDRCHLNCLAVDQGTLTHVTMFRASNKPKGWHGHRTRGGLVLDVRTGRPVYEHLSIPHSPRHHDGKLYVCDTGRGELVEIGPDRNHRFVWLPGFTRGLDFHGRYAFVGVSKPRAGEHRDLELTKMLADYKREPRCGVAIVDLKTKALAEWLTFEDADEVFAVTVLAGVRRPTVLDPSEQRHVFLSTGPSA